MISCGVLLWHCTLSCMLNKDFVCKLWSSVFGTAVFQTTYDGHLFLTFVPSGSSLTYVSGISPPFHQGCFLPLSSCPRRFWQGLFVMVFSSQTFVTQYPCRSFLLTSWITFFFVKSFCQESRRLRLWCFVIDVVIKDSFSALEVSSLTLSS